MDRIEVMRMGKEAEITIRFSTRIQYLRHGPAKPGKLLRVYIRLVDSDVAESDLMQQTLSSPHTDIVPRFTVTYPELSNGMLITFAQETSWDVRPGTDGRSIVIKVPTLAGAKDILAEIRAVANAELATAPAAEPAVATPAVPVALPAEPPAPPVPPAAPAKPVLAAPAPEATTAAPPPDRPAPPPAAAPKAPPATTAVAQAPAPAPVLPAAASPPAPMPVPEAPPAAAEPAPVMTAEQVESMARTFLAEARKAIADKDLPRAINRLNRTLGLPTNSQTEPAQALIGEVREMTGEIAKARAEYELYLKAFPNGPSVPQVREKLARLPKIEQRSRTSRRALPTEPGPAEWTFYGSLSQYFYKGNSHIEVTTPPPPGLLTFTTDVLSLTDQKALISTIDLNARRRDGISDTRIVVRDTNTQNYLAQHKNLNRLYSAYLEHTNRRIGYTFKVGRQNPTGGGVLERFDGLAVGYNLNDKWRINGVVGNPVEFMSPYKKSFYGFSVDMQAQPEEIGFSTYYLQQHLYGEVNREAVGIETRYFDTHAAVFGMLDYDLAFGDLNIAMVQANYRTDAGTNYFAYFDHRKTPPLGLTNALAAYLGGTPSVTLKEALDLYGLGQVRSDAQALTQVSDMLAIGVTHQFSPRWLLGTDYRAARISGSDAAGSFPAMPGSGLNHVFSVQAIGNALWTDNDVGVMNGSYIKGDTYDGIALGFNYVFLYKDAWRLDGNLRYYTQKDDDGTRQDRWSPSFKVGYRWKLMTLEAEVGAEDVKINGPTRIERSDRKYFFLGYRLEFR